MKTLVFCSILFILVISFVTFNSIYLTNFFEDIESRLDELPKSAAEAMNMSETEREKAIDCLDEIHSKWKGMENYIYFVTEHTEAFGFFDGFLPARSYFKSGSFADYASSLALCKDTLEHMKFDEGISLSNIF